MFLELFHFEMTNEALVEINHIERLKGLKQLIYDGQKPSNAIKLCLTLQAGYEICHPTLQPKLLNHSPANQLCPSDSITYCLFEPFFIHFCKKKENTMKQ